MRQATSKLTWALVLSGAIFLTGCGANSGAIANNSDTTSQTSCSTPTGTVQCRTTTHLRHRSLVSNYEASVLDVVDATQNRITDFSFGLGVGAQPKELQPSPDGSLTLVNDTGLNAISSFNNLEETLAPATVALGGFTESFVTSMNNQAGFAAVPNHSNGDFKVPGAIVRFNPADGTTPNNAIPFPNIRFLALDPTETHLLAFTDADDSAHWVDLTKTDPATQVPPFYTLALSDIGGSAVTLSRPMAAFFSGTKAFILSCGMECGGLNGASVTEIDTSTITTASTTTGTVIPVTASDPLLVKGARIGLIDTAANALYVAGSTGTNLIDAGGNNVQDGWLTPIDLTTMTILNTIRIGNGVKREIRNINGTQWIASLNCGVQSCVTLVNPTAVPPTESLLPNEDGSPIPNGNATGISLTAIKGDSTDDVYTIEGGELFIYDQQGNPVTSQFSTDIKGQGSDVIYIN